MTWPTNLIIKIKEDMENPKCNSSCKFCEDIKNYNWGKEGKKRNLKKEKRVMHFKNENDLRMGDVVVDMTEEDYGRKYIIQKIFYCEDEDEFMYLTEDNERLYPKYYMKEEDFIRMNTPRKKKKKISKKDVW